MARLARRLLLGAIAVAATHWLLYLAIGAHWPALATVGSTCVLVMLISCKLL